MKKIVAGIHIAYDANGYLIPLKKVAAKKVAKKEAAGSKKKATKAAPLSKAKKKTSK
jgi:hypothetical protein